MDLVGGRNGYFFDSTNLENDNQIEELHDESNTGEHVSSALNLAVGIFPHFVVSRSLHKLRFQMCVDRESITNRVVK